MITRRRGCALVLLLILTLFIGACPSDDGGDPMFDPNKPGVFIIEPADGASVTGLIRLAAVGTHPAGTVDSVTFRWVDLGMVACTDGQSRPSGGTFECDADTANLSTGEHVLQAEATVGAETLMSETIAVTVLEAAPPGTLYVSGMLVPPDGQSADDYELGNQRGESTVGALGRFTLPVSDAGVTLTIAERVDRDDPDDANVLLAYTVRDPSVSSDDVLEVSPMSTAKALVLKDVRLWSGSAQRAARVLAAAETLDEVAAFATLIKETFGLATDPATDAFIDAYEAAVAATVAAAGQQGYAPPTGGPVGNRSRVNWHGMDYARHLDLDLDTPNIQAETRKAAALGHLIRFAEIVPDATYDVFNDRDGTIKTFGIQNTAHFDMLSNEAACLDSQTPRHHAFTNVDGSETFGWSGPETFFGYLDVIGLIIDESADAILDELGFPDPDTEFNVNPIRPGIYEVRGFTGRYGEGLGCGETAFNERYFESMAKTAFRTNFGLMALSYVGAEIDGDEEVQEFVSEFLDISDLLSGCIVEMMNNLDPVDFSVLPSVSDAMRQFYDVAAVVSACLAGGFDEAIADTALDTGAKWLRRGARFFKLLVGLRSKLAKTVISYVGKAGAIGGLIEQVLTLYGLADQIWLGFFTTPVDTHLVRVGDPFSPIVTALKVNARAPQDVTDAVGDAPLVQVGDTVTLIGERFKPRPADGTTVRVTLTDNSEWRTVVRGTVVSDTELTFVVPEGLSDYVHVTLTYPGDGVTVENAVVVDPQLLCKTPGAPGLTWSPCGADAAEISPRHLFIPNTAVALGADYMPELRLVARGVNIRKANIVRLRAADGTLLPPGTLIINPAKANPDEVWATLVNPPAGGTYEVVLAPELGAAELTAKYSAGDLVPTGTTIQVLPAPVIDSTSPMKVANGEIFTLRGFNLGDAVEHVHVSVEIGTVTPIRQNLVVYAVDPWEGAADGAAPNVQASLAIAKMQHAIFAPWKDTAPQIKVWIQTPAGEVSTLIDPGDDQPPTHSRLVAVQVASGWADALSFVQGFSQPAGTMTWDIVLEPTPNPEDPGNPLCRYVPWRGHWDFDLETQYEFGKTTTDSLRPAWPASKPLPPVGVTYPPGRDLFMGCPQRCAYDAPVANTEQYLDHPSYNGFNTISGLPKTPCPATWSGAAAGDIRDRLSNHLEGFDIDPDGLYETIEANWLIVDIDVASGGGLKFTGPMGKAHLSGRVHPTQESLSYGIKIANPRESQAGIPIITLENIEDAELTIELGAALTAVNAQCSVGIRLQNASNVRLVQPVVKGCTIGIEIIDSLNVTITGGEVENYGENGTGIKITNSHVVEVSGTELRPHPGGNGVSATARGFVVGGGSKAVTIRPSGLRANAVGVEILEAEDVLVQGRVGLPAPNGGTIATGSGNAIGVDIVGPAKNVTIGGRPSFVLDFAAIDTSLVTLPLATIVANNGHSDAANGAGVRALDVDGLTIDSAYIGVWSATGKKSNRVGVRVVGTNARNVVIRNSHIGDNLESGVLVSNVVTPLAITDCLFAGVPLAPLDFDQPAFPTTDAGFAGDRCSAETVTTTYQPEAASTFFHSLSGVAGLRIADGSKRISVANSTFVGDGVRIENSQRVTMTGVGVWNAFADDRGATGDGIVIKNSASCQLRDVAVWKNTANGIVVDGSTGIAFEGCAADNLWSGMEVTGQPQNAGGENVVGRMNVKRGTSVIVETPQGAKWEHQRAKLQEARATAVIATNGIHGVHVHDGAVPTSLSGTLVIDNERYGVHVENHTGEVGVHGSAIGLHYLAAVDGKPAVAATEHPNKDGGVRLVDTLADVTIGGGGPRGNVISANGVPGREGHGVSVARGKQIVVEGNFIGLDPAGTADLGNLGDGIHATAPGDLRVINAQAAFVNVISGNGGHGVAVDALAGGGSAILHANYVGVDKTGTAAVGNALDGVHVATCVPNGTRVVVDDNLISGNDGDGVAADQCAAARLRVRHNAIGRSNGPMAGLPNDGAGISLFDSVGVQVDGNDIDAATPDGFGVGVRAEGGGEHSIDDNLVAGAGDANIKLLGGSSRNLLRDNVLSDGGGWGVLIGVGAVRNTLAGNSITKHTDEGIKLVAGGNQAIPAPTISSAFEAATGRWSFLGTAAAPDGSTVEVFADEDEEGRIPLVTTGVTGQTWSVPRFKPLAPIDGLDLCATVTDPLGNTSEFGCDNAPVGGGACDLGDDPPGEISQAYAGRVLTSRDASFVATGTGDGVSEALTDLTPGGGQTAVCGDLIAFSGGDADALDIYVRDLSGGTTTQLTTSAGDDTEPAFSRDCALLAFASNRAGSYDIFVMDSDGANLAAVTTDADEDRSPSYGADNTLVFSRKAVGGADFGLVTLAHGTVSPLVDGPGDEMDPAWHPTADIVAFTRCVGAVCQLALVDVATGVANHIGRGTCEDRGPSWLVAESPGAPPTEQLLVARRAPVATGATAAPYHVVLLSTDGAAQWRVTPETTEDTAPACCIE